jgi:hypothetical protein
MKPFAVIASPVEEFSAIVLSTGIELPHIDQNALCQALVQHQAKGVVVFDLLTANGAGKRRFFSTEFYGQAFSPKLDFTLINPGEDVRANSTRYISENLAEFDLSLLTPAMRFAARKGISI